MNDIPGFDPYKILLQRKQNKENPSISPTISFDVDDVKELEEFCKSNGILGMNFKNMNPKAVLDLLKNKKGGGGGRDGGRG